MQYMGTSRMNGKHEACCGVLYVSSSSPLLPFDLFFFSIPTCIWCVCVGVMEWKRALQVHWRDVGFLPFSAVAQLRLHHCRCHCHCHCYCRCRCHCRCRRRWTTSVGMIMSVPLSFSPVSICHKLSSHAYDHPYASRE